MSRVAVRNAKGEVLFRSSWYRPYNWKLEVQWPPQMVAIRNGAGKVLFHSLYYRPRHADLSRRSRREQAAFLQWQAEEYARWIKARDEARAETLGETNVPHRKAA